MNQGVMVGGRRPSIPPSMEDDLQWKTIFGGRHPSVEDDTLWKTTFDGRWPLCASSIFPARAIDHSVLFLQSLKVSYNYSIVLIYILVCIGKICKTYNPSWSIKDCPLHPHFIYFAGLIRFKHFVTLLKSLETDSLLTLKC